MSFGEAMLIIFIGIFGFLVVAFALLLAVMLLDALAEALGRAGIEATVADLVSAVIVALFVAFFVWFVFGSPGMERYERRPHAVEGREEWIDLREGTHYSQVERRNDD